MCDCFLTIFFNSIVKPETLSVRITWSHFVFPPKPLFTIFSSSDKYMLSFSFAVLEQGLKSSNWSSNCSIPFG